MDTNTNDDILWAMENETRSNTDMDTNTNDDILWAIQQNHREWLLII